MAGLFSEASRDSGPCSPPPWALSGQVDVPGDSPGPSGRALGVHLSTQLMSEGKTKELIFLMGNKCKVCSLTSCHQTHHLLTGSAACRFDSGGNVSTSVRLPQHRPCEVIRRSPDSARPVCTFPLQRQEEILRVRDEPQHSDQSHVQLELHHNQLAAKCCRKQAAVSAVSTSF